jgi:23S rRNA (adenine2503-C2)-methyltransferase
MEGFFIKGPPKGSGPKRSEVMEHASITAAPMEPIVLKDLLPEEIEELFAGWGWRHYRAQQVLQWLYRHGVKEFDLMTNLSLQERAKLKELCRVGTLGLKDRQKGSDGTEKWVFELPDGLCIEGVLIPEERHWTQCISTQVGCAMGCVFCRTASMGLKRNLRTWEIVDQVVTARRELKESRLLNLVFMGMGEPLANYEAVLKALRILLAERALNFSKRRITVSTCGLPEQLERLAGEGLGVNLAVSLNAPTDTLRSQLMPINRKYPLKVLLETCRRIPLAPTRRITFEYVLISSVNDQPHHATRLAKLLRGIRCKVNLIPYNPYPGSPFRTPPTEQILEFQSILLDSGLTATIRWSRGSDIGAACGQLAVK